MTAKELFEDGKLADAIREQFLAVERNPQDDTLRLALCEFLAFDSRFKTIIEQLERFENKDEAFYEFIEDWREIILADLQRHNCDEPSFFMEEPDHVKCSMKAVSNKDADLLDEAMEMLPVVEGHLDGREFEGCRDSDDALAGQLEFFVNGEYTRVPWEQLRKIRLGNLECLRDQLYRPTTITLVNGKSYEGYVPTHYVKNEMTTEELRCGMGTDYFEEEYGIKGHGIKLLMIGEEELNLTEFTQLEIRVQR